MSVKIIGAGFPRTGTTTLKICLETLGYKKTYHMKELLVNPSKLPYWLSLEKTGATDWDALYEGYQATVDFPCYPFYKEHMKRYPDAKVILTIRPFDTWYESASSTVRKAGPQTIPAKLKMLWRMATEPRMRKVVHCIQMFERIFWGSQFQGRFDDKAFAEQVYNKHIEDVKDYVPVDKLLVYDVREGWEPLCNFLGAAVPSEPVPHLNKKENFKTMLADLMEGKMV
ncbi:MAG: hypothetical protein OEQ53_20770 [Saprospiraceae bacterium]|nr:hypothetical protein [Saprospiraceae bacterium]